MDYDRDIMKAYATCTILPAFENGRDMLKGVVEIETANNVWCAFTVFGFTVAEIRERGYMQADLNCQSKGWRLESFRVNPSEKKALT
jgi:hypothetical protein